MPVMHYHLRTVQVMLHCLSTASPQMAFSGLYGSINASNTPGYLAVGLLSVKLPELG
jgi:hypothetical protein